MNMASTRAYTPEACEAAFEASFPREAQLAMAKLVKNSVERAEETFDALEIDQPQRKGTLAGVRRAILETGLKRIQERFKLKRATDLVHHPKAGVTVLVEADYIALTARCGAIPHTKYGDTLARSNMQTLFDLESQPEPTHRLYAVLRYRLDRTDPLNIRLAAIEIVFPDPKSSVPIASIDLMARFESELFVDVAALEELAALEEMAKVKPRKRTRKDEKQA